ncbi:MAG TPA: glycosyltransferase family 39 protein, partial [Edaphobacter sp.]|nr:glycosyltransferase family 39 protein [Edaphobacter sp.]
MNDSQQPAVSGVRNDHAAILWFRQRLPNQATVREFVVLFAVTTFLLLFGLVPVFGGDQLGLVGADEPRYAQIAREMLTAHSDACHAVNAKMVPKSLRIEDIRNSFHCIAAGTVTPILYGKPWLEKPALYYWRAMSFFKEFGVSDWTARLPSSSATLALVVLVFLHMRRFRPGGHLGAALITVSCVAIVSFARGASTDMQLAAPFCIGMLGWYAWYETGKKFWLFDLYFFGAAATLAKGPVAPFLALSIILLFAGLRREWSLLRRTIWWPGVTLYLIMVLPWYIAVQKRNPTFYRFFFLEHNLSASPPIATSITSPSGTTSPSCSSASCHGLSSPSALSSTPSKSPSPSGRFVTIPAVTSVTRVPATLSPSFWSSGLSFPSSSSPSPDPSSPATSCLPFLLSPSSQPTTSIAFAAKACQNGCSG